MIILNMHGDKCSNKHCWILKIDHKRQTTVLPVMFVLVGMMFIVPAITEKALARVEGDASSSVGPFSQVSGHMSAGRFVVGPINLGNRITWATIGNGPVGGGNELGFVDAHAGIHAVRFHFSNPATGRNTCSITGSVPFGSRCTITQGIFARATYVVTFAH